MVACIVAFRWVEPLGALLRCAHVRFCAWRGLCSRRAVFQEENARKSPKYGVAPSVHDGNQCAVFNHFKKRLIDIVLFYALRTLVAKGGACNGGRMPNFGDFRVKKTPPRARRRN